MFPENTSHWCLKVPWSIVSQVLANSYVLWEVLVVSRHWHTHIYPACCPSTNLLCCLLTPIALLCIFKIFVLGDFFAVVPSCLIINAAVKSFLPGNCNPNKRWALPYTQASCLKGWKLWVIAVTSHQCETSGLLLPLSLQVWPLCPPHRLIGFLDLEGKELFRLQVCSLPFSPVLDQIL